MSYLFEWIFFGLLVINEFFWLFVYLEIYVFYMFNELLWILKVISKIKMIVVSR